MHTNQVKQEKQLATRVTLVGALLDLVLGVLKIVIGLLSNSYALVTDGIHSLSDLITDAFVLGITRVSREKPDAEHPYGHGRFETMGTIIIGITLFSIAGVICYESVLRLIELETIQVPGKIAMAVAVVSIVSKEWIYHYTKKAAIEINSSLLLANAWHSRTDALSSVAVLVGVTGAILGYPWMDTLAAIFVAIMIASIAWRLISTSLKELVDTALPEQELKAIKQHIAKSEGIVGAHSLRSRLHGGQVFLDIHVQVANTISVSEGHYIADCLSQSLKVSFPEITDVVVHIDPELDTDDDNPLLLPLRDEVMLTLLKHWSPVLKKDDIVKANFHYLEEKIQAEIFINNSLINNELIDSLNSLVKDVTWLKSLKIYGSF